MVVRVLGAVILAIMLVGAPPASRPALAAITTGCGSPTVSPTTAVLGSQVSMTVKVSPAPDRGSVSFMYVSSGGNALPLGSSPIDPGTGSASLTTTAIPLGGWRIIGQYRDPTGYYAFCQTSGTSILVVQHLTSTTIRADRDEAVLGDEITWTATVSPNPGPGLVVFPFRRGTSTSSREASLDAESGTATIRRSDLEPGVTEVWASFQKLPDYAPSQSPPVTVTVRQPNPGPLELAAPGSVLQLHPITIRYTAPPTRPTTGLTFYYRSGSGETVRFDCSLDVAAKSCRATYVDRLGHMPPESAPVRATVSSEVQDATHDREALGTRRVRPPPSGWPYTMDSTSAGPGSVAAV